MQTKKQSQEDGKPLNNSQLEEINFSAEESDAEFSKTHNVKLRRPPTTSNEALKTL